jgi:hypothetical protein
MRVTALLLMTLVIAKPGSAQWLKYPAAGIPRTSDGKPNLNAPTPRTPDGKPDLSGIWDIEHNAGCPPETCFDLSVGREFSNLGFSIQGLPYQPWAAELAKKRTAEFRKDDPWTLCTSLGIVRLQTAPLYRKIIQLPGLLVMLNERMATYRQIFTDGRPFPEDPQPSWIGYSVGRWDGDTLVVETTGFKDGIWLDARGSPMTDAAKIIERYRRTNFGKMEIELTVNDPKAYTAPFTVKLNHFLMADTELVDYICQDNEKSLQHFVTK